MTTLMKRFLLLSVATVAFFAVTSVAMALAPTVVTGTSLTEDADNDGTVDKITITFSEVVDIVDTNGIADGLTSLALGSGCTIPNGDYTKNDSANLVITGLTGCTAGDTSIIPSITYTAVANCATNFAICDGTPTNQMANGAQLPPSDGAKPAILSAVTGDNNSDGSVDRLVLTFSEQVDVTDGGTDNDITLGASVGTATITASLYTVENTTTLTYTITTSITGNTSLTVTPTYATGGAGSIVDNSVNEMANNETVTGTDGAKPQIKTFTYQDNDSDGKVDQFLVAFTETLNAASVLHANDLTMGANVGDFLGAAFGDTEVDLVTDAVASVTVVLGTESTAQDTAENLMTIAISSADDFSLTDGTNTNNTLGAQSGNAAFADGAAPVIKTFTYQDTGASPLDGKIDTFLVTFTETVAAGSVLGANDLSMGANVGDFTGAVFGALATDLIEGAVASVTVPLGTAATAVDTNEGVGTLAIVTQNAFSLTDGTNLSGKALGAQAQATYVDGAAPFVTALNMQDAAGNNGIIDTIVLTYSENLTDTAAAANGFDLATEATHGTCDAESADPAVSATLTLTFTCTVANTSLTALSLGFTAGANIVDAAANQSSSKTFTSASTPAITDQAKPVVLTVVKSTGSNKNVTTFTYSEPMYIDIINNQDGNIDGADIEATESMTSTASVGGIDAAGSIENFGNLATAGTVTQSAETCNTLAVAADGLSISVTFNNITGCYFTNSVTTPSGNFTPDTASYILARLPTATPTTYQRINASGTPAVSGAWDLTAPSQIASFVPGTTGTTYVTLNWSPISASADFSVFRVYYSGTTGVTYANGTLWSSTDDSALATSSTYRTVVTGLATASRYYFIIYAVDIAGNLSTVSSEITDISSVKSVGGGSGASTVIDLLPPSPPSKPKIEYKDEKIVLTWIDPDVSDFVTVGILKGKNEATVMTEVVPPIVKGIQIYTDTDFQPGDTLKYILYAKDINNNKSANTETLIVTIPQAQAIEPVTDIDQPVNIEQPQTEDPNTIKIQSKIEKLNVTIAKYQKSVDTYTKSIEKYTVKMAKLNSKKKADRAKIAAYKKSIKNWNKLIAGKNKLIKKAQANIAKLQETLEQ